MLRAIRLVVDTGMHAKHWTREPGGVLLLSEHRGDDQTENSRCWLVSARSWPPRSAAFRVAVVLLVATAQLYAFRLSQLPTISHR